MNLGEKHDVCVLVKVKAFSGDAAWNLVHAAFRDNPDVTVAGAPRCDRSALKHEESGDVRMIEMTYAGDLDPLTRSIAANPGLLDKVDPEARERITQMLGMTWP